MKHENGQCKRHCALIGVGNICNLCVHGRHAHEIEETSNSQEEEEEPDEEEAPEIKAPVVAMAPDELNTRVEERTRDLKMANRQLEDTTKQLIMSEKLAAIAWWDWPFETIMARLADFQSGDIEAFCERWS